MPVMTELAAKVGGESREGGKSRKFRSGDIGHKQEAARCVKKAPFYRPLMCGWCPGQPVKKKPKDLGIN